MLSREKKPRGGKIALEKALKARLAILTEGLSTAEVGAKGIDLVKEIKELQVLLTAVDAESNVKIAKSEEPRVVVVWGSSVTEASVKTLGDISGSIADNTLEENFGNVAPQRQKTLQQTPKQEAHKVQKQGEVFCAP